MHIKLLVLSFVISLSIFGVSKLHSESRIIDQNVIAHAGHNHGAVKSVAKPAEQPVKPQQPMEHREDPAENVDQQNNLDSSETWVPTWEDEE